MNIPVQRKENLAKASAFIVLTLLLVLAFSWAAAPAHADDETWFNEYHVEAELDEDGRMAVTTRIEYDFQDVQSRGIYLSFVTRQDIDGDPDHQRAYKFSDFTASSSTGAATDVNVEETSTAVGVYIGDPDKQDVTGVHSYEVSYVVEGIPNAGVGDNDEDEIYWNIIGSGFAEPIKDFRMALRTPAEATDTACWYGESGSRTECEVAGADSNVAEFQHTGIEPGQGVTIAAQYPAGSFDEAWTIIEPKASSGSGGLRVEPKTLALVGAGALALLGGGAFYSRRSKKDEVYVGLPPGLEPAAGQEAEVALAHPAKEYPVQFHPPVGQIPAEVGALVSEKADPNYLAATIVDLAVRGYVTIIPEPKKSWKLLRTDQEARGLPAHEQNVLDALFREGNREASLDDLDSESEFELRREVTEMGARLKERGWFSGRLRNQRSRPGGLRMLMFWIIIIFVGVSNGLVGRGGLLPIAVIGVAVLFFFARSKRPRRTAKGSAVYAQAMGFRKFLETADAHQLRFEAGEDIFSRYLPYAMVFGVVKRWVELFRTLPPEVSARLPAATWIQGPHTYQNLPEQLSGMDLPATLMRGEVATAIAGQSRSTSGSSGGSAFSGSSGGGSSGGGVSGGGGGRW